MALTDDTSGQTGGVPVPAEERARMDAVVRALEAVESDEPASPVALERAVAAADRDRARRGIPALLRAEIHPEEELYRRARALGLR